MMVSFLYRTLLVLLIILSVFFYHAYNYTSIETYQKRFLVVKKGDPDFLENVAVQNHPIINMDSLSDFIKRSVVRIFNYEVAFGREALDKNKDFFSPAGFNDFSSMFDFRLQNERDNGVVLKEAAIVEGPFYLGYFTYANVQAWQFYVEIMETTTGLDNKPDTRKRDVFIVIRTMDFSKNNKGLAIDSFDIR
jgi:hypothetical protein